MTRFLFIAIVFVSTAFGQIDTLRNCADTTDLLTIHQLYRQTNTTWGNSNTVSIPTTPKWAWVLICFSDTGAPTGLTNRPLGHKVYDLDSLAFSSTYWTTGTSYLNYPRLGSVKNYYSDVSAGLVNITGKVVNTVKADTTYNWIRLPNTFASYSDNLLFMIRDALHITDSLGLTDNSYTQFIFMVCRPLTSLLTAGRMATFEYPLGSGQYKYGAWINTFNLGGIGLICHEMGHATFGWWDEYCVGGSGCMGSDPITFDLMAYGVGNGIGGNCPAYPNPFDMTEAGFISPTILGSTNSGLLVTDTYPNINVYQHPASSNSMFHSGNLIGADERGRDTGTFYMIRTRTLKQGFNQYTPDSNYSARGKKLEVWRSRPNDYVELVYASGSNYPNGALFPADSVRQSYNFSTTPSTGLNNSFALNGIHPFGAGVKIDTVTVPSYVVTQNATDTAQTSAVLHGIANVGGSSTSGYFVYWVKGGVRDSAFCTQSPFTGIVGMSGLLANLGSDTLYRYMAVICNAGGLVYGDSVPFRTLAAPTAPTVVTSAIDNVTPTSLRLNGIVNAHGAITNVKFLYGTSSNVYNSDSIIIGTSAGYVNTPFSRNLTGLTPGTTYFTRIKGQNSFGTTVGSETQSTTPLTTGSPTAITSAASNITSTTGIVNGTVNPNNLQTTIRFVYGKVSGTYTDSILAAQSPIQPPNNTATVVNAGLSGLSVGTTYYVRVRAYNTSGNSQGTEVSFTTSPIAPTGSIAAATSITTTTVTVNGFVNPNGASTTVYFLKKLHNASVYDSALATQSPVTGLTLTAVSKGYTGLSPDSTYDVLLAFTNSVGYLRTSATSFKMLPNAASAPTVTTGNETHITTTAVLTGTVSANGASSVVIIDYGTDTTFSGNRTANESPITTNSASITANISGLAPSTLYYYRVRATNSQGTTLGLIRSFTTDALPIGGGQPAILVKE